MNKRRVVITGVGAVSSIGNNIKEIAKSLEIGKSGVGFNQEFVDYGLNSHVSGILPDPKKLVKEVCDKKATRFMSDGAAFLYLSALQAIEDANLSNELVQSFRTGVIAGNGAGSPVTCVHGADVLRNKGLKRVSPFLVSQCMVSSSVANLSVLLGTKGPSFTVASACASSAHAIVLACKEILCGDADVMLSGGCEDLNALNASVFDAARALSTKYNDVPTKASRPYDVHRDGFVISGGGGVVILEELRHALDRGAYIYGEIKGYAATSDGENMVTPSGEGATRCMRNAIASCVDLLPSDIDYINTHGTSTLAGDIVELQAIKEVFGKEMPHISSTKALTGHSIGAAGVHELIYSIIMMEEGFIVPSANIHNLDPNAKGGYPIITEKNEIAPKVIISNSFGFGGTNACLIIKKYSTQKEVEI
jgi:3-oxoacyl-[acyl-carrier-protein] synthase-1